MAAVLVHVDLGQKHLVKDSDVKSFLQLACHQEQALHCVLLDGSLQAEQPEHNYFQLSM